MYTANTIVCMNKDIIYILLNANDCNLLKLRNYHLKNWQTFHIMELKSY